MDQQHAPQPQPIDVNQLLSQMGALRQKNLAFFEKRYPNIYKHFKDYRLENSRVNINPETGQIDLISDEQSLYQGDAKAYAQQEVADFCRSLGPGSQLTTVDPSFAGQYNNPRFFHRRISRIIGQSPLTSANYRRYHLEEFYPMVVFFGVGAGFHIPQFLQERDVHHVIIMESNPDHFAASLYTTDWEALHQGYEVNQGRSLELLVGKLQKPINIFALVWNRLVTYCPIFPVATLMYNHRANPVFQEPIERICSDIRVFLNIFGYYDDEINQLNNALHNFKQQIPPLPIPPERDIETPVCIIGSGPSLNQRIELIKKHRDKLILISCGTALASLYKHRIVPDAHIELESHYITYQALQHVTGQMDPDYLRQVRLIGAAQLSPLAFRLFQKKRIYFKTESAIAGLFGSFGQNIANGTPTCTQAALALALHHRCKQIYLFGTDFGYRDRAIHHAEGVVYYDDKAQDIKNKAKQIYENAKLFEVEAVDGGQILTSDIFFNSKRKTEDLARVHANRATIHNCSDGAEIEHAPWLSPEEFDSRVAQESEEDRDYLVSYWFDDHCRCVPEVWIPSKLERLQTCLQLISEDIKRELNILQPDLPSLTKACYRISYYLERVIRKQFNDCYSSIRGSIWHLLLLGYTHAFALKDTDARQKFINLWKKETALCLEEMVAHYQSIVFKEFDLEKDPWLRLSIDEPEPKTHGEPGSYAPITN